MPTKQIETRKRKQVAINKLCSQLGGWNAGATIDINKVWENKAEKFNLKDIWSSRAYFIQDLKRLAGDNFEVISVQRKGTIVKRIKK